MENEAKASAPLTSDQIEVTVQPKKQCMIELAVKAKKPLMQKAHKTSLKDVAKHVSIPGFRKGKAPTKMVEKKYAKTIHEKAHKTLADLAFREAEELTQIPLVSQDAKISFDMKHFGEEEAEMTFQFETEPTVPEISMEQLSLSDVEKKEVGEKDVEETIAQIQKFFARYEKVENRPVELGDTVVIDLHKVSDEGEKEQVFSKTKLEVNETTMAKWMRELLLGMNLGETKEGTSIPDEDASEEDKKNFAPQKIEITLHEINKAILPEVDDLLAARVGVKTAQEMKDNLLKLLTKQENDRIRHKQRDAIAEGLLEHVQFDLPRSLIDKEIRHRFGQLAQDPNFQRKFRSMNEEEQKQTIEDIKQQSERAIRLFYTCKKIVKDHKIDIDPKDLQKEISTPLEAMFADPNAYKYSQDQTHEQNAVAVSRLMLEKAQDFLIDQLQKKTSEK